MNIMYLSEDAINDIKINFNKYKSHFTDETNEWFIKEFDNNGWLRESKIIVDEFQMNYDEDYNVSDRKNVEILYEALKDLSPAIATDERIWAGLAFVHLWDFIKYRRKDVLQSGKQQEILNSFFFMRGIKRSCFVNCISRLWWAGFLLFDKENTNHYAALDLVCESAFPSNIVLISSNNFMSNRRVGLGVMDCLIERRKNGEKIGRYHYVEANKYLNCVGGITLLDSLERSEVKQLVDEHLNDYFGA